MGIRDAVSSLRPQPKATGKGKSKVATAPTDFPAADPERSFEDFTKDDGGYVAVLYRGNVVVPLVVSRSDMEAIEGGS